MSTTQVSVLLLSSLSVLTTWAGVWLATRLRENARAIATGIGFSTGIMLLISLLELVPESTGIIGTSRTLLSFVLGAGLVWSAHLMIPHRHLSDEAGAVDRRLIRSAYLVAFGLILHDGPEGFAMANAYIASPELGLLVAVAIALHNAPEEFAMAVPAVMIRRKRFLYAAAVLSALAEPAGAVVGLIAVGIAPSLNAHFMAFAAGAMTFVSLHELVPMAQRYRRPVQFGLGLGVSLAVYLALSLIGGGAF
ncbi:MAG: ZIP family metal transporter [Thermoleophilia bacterium]|nr:ZIP family metal transporter [Thermoleophilia bacterium]